MENLSASKGYVRNEALNLLKNKFKTCCMPCVTRILLLKAVTLFPGVTKKFEHVLEDEKRL